MKLVKDQSGFTMIELVVVIVILGILAAFAVPQFANLRTEARVAAVNAMAGGLRGAVAVARAKYQVVNSLAATTVDMDGVSVTVSAATGIPRSATGGINLAIADYSGFTYTTGAPTATFWPASGGSATCDVTYTDVTGAVGTNIGGC
ncbi:MAG: prepilin-type N-terminal cleavage/methylation domain-containing protein [Nitrospirae bacterium]|nr:prepilin-type N-terminal cleavage/methylation domain-containing protein [Nitrospirota bacterium]